MHPRNLDLGVHNTVRVSEYENLQKEIYGFNKTLPGISYNFSNVQYGTGGYPSGYVMDWMPFPGLLLQVP